MDMVTYVQILDEASCISYCANTPGKGMHPAEFPNRYVLWMHD